MRLGLDELASVSVVRLAPVVGAPDATAVLLRFSQHGVLGYTTCKLWLVRWRDKGVVEGWRDPFPSDGGGWEVWVKVI